MLGGSSLELSRYSRTWHIVVYVPYQDHVQQCLIYSSTCRAVMVAEAVEAEVVVVAGGTEAWAQAKTKSRERRAVGQRLRGAERQKGRDRDEERHRGRGRGRWRQIPVSSRISQSTVLDLRQPGLCSETLCQDTKGYTHTRTHTIKQTNQCIF